MTQETLVIVLACAVALLLFAVAWLTYTLQKLSRGKNGASLESAIMDILDYHEEYRREHKKSLDRIGSLENRMRRAIRNVSTVRFDPFEGAGSGKQSFAIALLDDDGNGAVVSSLHARDSVRVFAKPISDFKSTHELSDEELRAIAQSQ